jgi:arylsulfatase
MSSSLSGTWFVGATLIALGGSGALSAADTTRPNVIIVLSDDQGYGDFSCHGNPVLKTPNLDKLHAQSIRLTDYHVAPMCSPTRGQLLTGMDCLRNGAVTVGAGRSFVHRGIPLMPEIFAAGGYKTALFGKWHLGDNYPHLPHHRGFHEAVYHPDWGIVSLADAWRNDYFDGRFRHNGVLKQYKGYCTDLWFDLAMNWMKDRAAKKEPFFVYLPTNAPHSPHWVAEKYRKPYEGKGPAAFFGMIANLDENMGRLEQFLTDNKLRDDTIVIYGNDNGGTAGVPVFNAGLRAYKTSYYEGGHRAACFVRWPNGNLRKPCDLDALTEVQDLLPTLIDLCGLPKPEKAKLDGTSLANLLRGKTDTLPDRMLVVQYGDQPNGKPLGKGNCAVLWNKWRLVHGSELYDLKTDLGQAKDVAVRHPEVLQKMRDHYEAWWKEIEPLTRDYEPVSIGAEEENPATLTATDWPKHFCDHVLNLLEGTEVNGPWHILVEKDGEYHISLRRWPKEADVAITTGVPAFRLVDDVLPPGRALPIAKMRLKIADLDETKPVGEKDREVTFTVKLKAGQKLTMQSWCYDARGRELCGAYFAYVLRK